MSDEKISEDTMLAFFLGQLDEDERGNVEERVLTDPAFREHLEAFEEDLIDDYVDGTLEGQQREQFEAHYLTAHDGAPNRGAQGLLRRIKSLREGLNKEE